MSTAAFPASRPLLLLCCAFWLCLTLGAASTKLAGAAWLLLCFIGLHAVCQARRRRTAPARDQATHAAGLWLLACALSLALEAVMLTYWHESWEGQHARIRLLLAAAAAWALTRHTLPDSTKGGRTVLAVACAAVVAFVVGVTGFEERSFPTHPIPWAAGVSFLVCLTLPSALFDSRLHVRLRLALGLAGLLGMLAVLLSLSRGVYAIAPWVALLAALALWRALRNTARPASRRPAIVTAAAATAAVLAVGIMSAHDIQSHLKRAVDEFSEAWTADSPSDYDNSVGARIYLWKTATGWVRAAPWAGIGAEARASGIRDAGLQTHVPTVARLGHLHNEYLNAQVDHGLPGLLSLLVLQAGLAAAAWRLRRSHRVAALQLTGILFMHSTCGLSNVNFAHNYYGLMLASAVAIALACARWNEAAQYPEATAPSRRAA